jgi:hypothetical protein
MSNQNNTGMEKTFKAHLSWVAHWFPRRADAIARKTLRWQIQNAKVARWILGGRYPSKAK